jgi:SAM-dependent methyltransferase
LQVKFTVESLGWRRGALELLTGRRPYEPASDRSFDIEHGTDTAGSVSPAELGIDDAERRDKAILYLPSPPRVTRWLFNHVGIDFSDFTFVDLGCGKGRVLLIAAERPFRRIVGVEISAELAAIARANVASYQPESQRIREIEVVNIDAAAFDMPDGDLLLHLYHPFDPEISAAVLRRLETSLTDAPRRVVVGYLLYTAAVEPVKSVFSGFPWLRLVRYEQSRRGHYNWLLYSNR